MGSGEGQTGQANQQEDEEESYREDGTEFACVLQHLHCESKKGYFNCLTSSDKGHFPGSPKTWELSYLKYT